MIRELSQDEKQSIESSENYLNFIGKSSKFIERVLSEKIDLFTEYDSKIEENRLFENSYNNCFLTIKEYFIPFSLFSYGSKVLFA